jgi:transposase
MRYELTDHEWAAIRPMLPNKPRGVPRVNDRRVLNGIFWVLRSGAPWRDLPDSFGRGTGEGRPFELTVGEGRPCDVRQSRHAAENYPRTDGKGHVESRKRQK